MTTADLSTREAEVLAELADHASNAEIAARLFISVRTVESHVAALLRKTGAGDRRQLAALAGTRSAEPGDSEAVGTPLPMPASSFVGRDMERADLEAALREHRLVTALGPGGIGKTRLALSIIPGLRASYSGAAFYVDLVPLTDPSMLAATISAAIGLGDQQGRTPEQVLLHWLSSRQVLLVLDNCEHLLDAAAELLEQALADCPGLTVLATSRSRLGVPGEWIFAVLGLSVDDDGGGDAVELFAARAVAAGAEIDPADRARIAEICRALDGSALAIELAAARVPSLGLDGVEAGLTGNRLELLMSGRRSGGRHRSLRATLSWSIDLLTSAERAILRRSSVFAGPFSGESASALFDGWAPRVSSVQGVLADLADQSLVSARPGSSGMRYRLLEAVRQYGDQLLEEFGEAEEAHLRHLTWCRQQAEALRGPRNEDLAGWRRRFDEVADEIRSAVTWAATQPELTGDACLLAELHADLSFEGGRPAEAQRMYELAAGLATDADRAIRDLDLAAGAAELRHFGNDALRLRRAAADRAASAGRSGEAAWQLARSSELITRASGTMAAPPPLETALDLIDEAEALAGDDVRARTRILVAKASAVNEADPLHAELSGIALAAARASNDLMAESAALDQTCVARLIEGDLVTAADDSIRRVEMLDHAAIGAEGGMEFPDALLMAAECSCGIGDLPGAFRYGDRMLTLPSYAEETHLGTSRVLLATALAGDFAACAADAERFGEGWERAGRPQAGSLSMSALAASAAWDMLGRPELGDEWRRIAAELRAERRSRMSIDARVFSPLEPLHSGRIADALSVLDKDPMDSNDWCIGLWRPWYTAAWCEVAVLAGSADAEERVARARTITAPNRVASVLVERSAALLADDATALPGIAARLEELGAVYQAARTRVMAGDPSGAEWMSANGIIPMAWPVTAVSAS